MEMKKGAGVGSGKNAPITKETTKEENIYNIFIRVKYTCPFVGSLTRRSSMNHLFSRPFGKFPPKVTAIRRHVAEAERPDRIFKVP